MTAGKRRRTASDLAHGHSHGGPAPKLTVPTLHRVLLIGFLVLMGGATVAGIFVLQPDPAAAPPKRELLGEGVSAQDATVVGVTAPCPVLTDDADPTAPPPSDPPQACNELTFTLDSPDLGEDGEHTIQVPPSIVLGGLKPGDGVQVMAIPGAAGESTGAVYGFFGVKRDLPIGLMAGLFLIVVALVARLRGILAVVGLVFAGAVLVRFMLPALLAGESGIAVALVSSSAIMYVVLYLAHGLSLRTSSALAGTLFGVAITTALGMWAVEATKLSGVADETAQQLYLFADGINFSGLLTAAVIIAGLGVLNDVTITQASAIWEVRAADPSMTRRRLFAAGMRIGRDHIASTIYTIVFAYAGTALTLLMLISLYDRPALELLSDDAIAEEVVRTLSSAIGLVLAVPITTAIAVAVAGTAVADGKAG